MGDAPARTLLQLSVGLMSLSAIAAAAHAAPSLTPHKAKYDVRISVLGGTLTTVVSKVGPGFMAKSVIEPTGLSKLVVHGAIQESSYFLVDPDGIEPQQYRSIDTLSSTDKAVTLDFNWRTDTVKGSVNGKDFQYDLDGRVHDRVSIQYELMVDLMSGRMREHYTLLDGDELKHLNVRNIGARKVKVPFGTFEVVGIEHSEKDSSRVTTLWLAKKLGYLPVIIEQHRDGDLQVRAVLKSYDPMTPTAPQTAD